MHDVHIKKGYRFRMAGAPSRELTVLADPPQLAFLPEKMPYVKPRLKIAEGDRVKIGSLLFEDKNTPAVQFLSPAGGIVGKIQYGQRRVVEAIIIDRDCDNEQCVSFSAISPQSLEDMTRDSVVDHILRGGLWWIFRQLPFRRIPDPHRVPSAIIVGLSAKEPFQPAPEVYLRDREGLMSYGLKILDKLARGRVLVFSDGDTRAGVDDRWVTHKVFGNYPADDPGALLYHVKENADQNRAWTIAGQDLLLLAQLLVHGRYPVDRIVSVGGSRAPVPQHFKTRLGVPLAHLVDGDAVKNDVRFVVGGLLRGYGSDIAGFMGHYETSLNLVPRGAQAEFLALFNPGFSKPTFSRTFLSRLNPGQLTYTCTVHGGKRACIACMHCADICPVDILPHMAYKAIWADEIEESLEHGLLDCVECGLCSYVCPSKIELSKTFIEAKAAYAKEQVE
jgi:Na+-transporting NADH:ubiquinone oxidoreductase subunit A